MSFFSLDVGADHIRLRNGSAYQINMHSHPEMQVTVPLEHCSFEVMWAVVGGYERKLLGAGCVCVIPPNVEHQFSWISKAHFINLHISAQTLAAAGISLDGRTIPVFDPAGAFIGAKDDYLLGLVLGLERTIERYGTKAMPYYRDALNMAAYHMVLNYLRTQDTPPVHNSAYVVDQRVRKALHYMEANVTRAVSIDDIAKESGLSAFHFQRLFKKAMGISVARYQLVLRMEEAKQQLLRSDRSVAGIAQNLGFASQAHFGRLFKKFIGASPSQYRKRVR
ncbi:MAG: helix-turn-helix domain-containing protein [Alphaproteobacteria bacterium]